MGETTANCQLFQPTVQQTDVLECLCNTQKPMPSFDQFMARQVGLLLWNIFTQVSFSLVMTSLDA